MLDIETNISKVTLTAGELHCYMDEAGISIPDMPDHVVSSIMYSEVTFSLFFHDVHLTYPMLAEL